MDRDRLREIRERLEYLDDRYTYRLRASQGSTLVRPGPEDLERRQRELAELAIELRETLAQLVAALESD